MTLAPYVQILGRGPGRARSLTQPEAQAAMACILSGHAAPEATGALLMLLRMQGETAPEIAGFVQAAQDDMAGFHTELPGVALDWSSYASGRTRGAPWFLLAARLVASAGFPVLIHGWNGPVDAVRAGLTSAGIPTVHTPADARSALARDGIAYLPLESLSPRLHDLLRLREVLGLRSCLNTVARMINPARARASVQGVFHPSYRILQADAARLLGWQSLCVIKGGGGEFEGHPAKAITAFGLQHGALWQDTLPASWDGTRRLADPLAHAPQDLDLLWTHGAQALDDRAARPPLPADADTSRAIRHAAEATPQRPAPGDTPQRPAPGDTPQRPTPGDTQQHLLPGDTPLHPDTHTPPTLPGTFAEAVVLTTATLALATLGVAQPRGVAHELWAGRTRSRAA